MIDEPVQLGGVESVDYRACGGFCGFCGFLGFFSFRIARVLPPEERQLVFERFARGGGAGRRTGSEGAGLGLSLVDEHVKMHGGRIWVEDRLDGQPGARFAIELMASELDD